jgi:hypothetical protein
MQAYSIDKGLRSCGAMLSTLLLSSALLADDLTVLERTPLLWLVCGCMQYRGRLREYRALATGYA